MYFFHDTYQSTSFKFLVFLMMKFKRKKYYNCESLSGIIIKIYSIEKVSFNLIKYILNLFRLELSNQTLFENIYKLKSCLRIKNICFWFKNYFLKETNESNY